MASMVEADSVIYLWISITNPWVCKNKTCNSLSENFRISNDLNYLIMQSSSIVTNLTHVKDTVFG